MGEVHDFKFDDDFSSTAVESLNFNTNATSSESTNTIPKIIPAPIDPLRQLISSDNYIESLEKKLKRVKGVQSDVVKGKDIINSLQTAKQDHFQRMINSDQSEIFQTEDLSRNNTIAFSIQRKINPDKQPLNPQELIPLVNDDILAKVSEVQETSGNKEP